MKSKNPELAVPCVFSNDMWTSIHACLLASLLGLTGVPAMADDLLMVYRRAQEQDPVFETARYALQAAQQKLPQARAGLLPSVNLNGNSGKQQGQVSFSGAPFIDRDVRTKSWTLQLSQPLLRIGNWSAYEQADAQVRQADAQYAQAQQELILRVAQAYFDVLVAKDGVKVVEAQLKAVEQQLVLAKRNFEVGMATITDSHEAKSRFDLSRAQRIAAVNELESKRAELERITGELPVYLAALKKEAVLPSLQPADVQSWVSSARNQHPLVRIQQAAQEVAEQEIAKNRAGHYPTLDFTASYGGTFSSGSLSSPADVETRNRSRQVGLQLSIPIYSGGATNARVKEAAANLYKAKAELESARRQAGTLARQAHAGVNNGQSQIEALISAVASSKSAVDANKIGYRIGTRINIDVLNAEQQLAVAQRDLTKARYETLLQGLRLKAATGILTESDLVTVNHLLNLAGFPESTDTPMRDVNVSIGKEGKARAPQISSLTRTILTSLTPDMAISIDPTMRARKWVTSGSMSSAEPGTALGRRPQ